MTPKLQSVIDYDRGSTGTVKQRRTYPPLPQCSAVRGSEADTIFAVNGSMAIVGKSQSILDLWRLTDRIRRRSR